MAKLRHDTRPPDHDRRHRGAPSYVIPVWNGIFEHYDRIGSALWVFLWLIDKVTQEKNGMGIVLGGAPVKAKRIAADLKGSNEDVILRQLRTLIEQKYIQARRTPYGFVIEVLNSRKFNIWKPENRRKVDSLDREPTNSRFSGGREPTIRRERTDDSSAENRLLVGNKEEKVVIRQKDTAMGGCLSSEAPAEIEIPATTTTAIAISNQNQIKTVVEILPPDAPDLTDLIPRNAPPDYAHNLTVAFVALARMVKEKGQDFDPDMTIRTLARYYENCDRNDPLKLVEDRVINRRDWFNVEEPTKAEKQYRLNVAAIRPKSKG